MSIAQALKRSQQRPSNQTLADLALALDQERRLLAARLAEIDSEIAALAKQMH
jgi:hypothetical protein